MNAIIHRVSKRATGMIDVAGEPLVTRQLQWLRSAGCERVAVEVGPGPVAQAELHRLSFADSLGTDVVLIPSATPLGTLELARRAGFDLDAPLLTLAEDVLGDGDLAVFAARAGEDGALGRMPAPFGTTRRLDDGFVRILRRGRPTHTRVAPGWGCRVRTQADGLALGVAALRGHLPKRGGVHDCPIQIHGTEHSPGIFFARGAVADEGAVLVPPVLVGRGAVLRSGAEVGPEVVLGERSVVDSGAVVRRALIQPGTLVGRGARLKRRSAGPRGIRELDSGRFEAVTNASVLAARRRPPLLPRLFALGLATLLGLPAMAVVGLRRLRGQRSFVRVRNHRTGAIRHEGITGVGFADLLPRLLDVAGGLRHLVGVLVPTAHVGEETGCLEASACSAPLGALGIDRALTGGKHDLKSRLRAHAWYAAAKSLRVDADLLLRTLRGIS